MFPPSFAAGMLLLGSIEPRADGTMTRTLEADARLLEGKWVMKNPPSPWKVTLEFKRRGNRLSLEMNADMKGFGGGHGRDAVELKESGGRRYIVFYGLVRYALDGHVLRLDEQTVQEPWLIFEDAKRSYAFRVDGTWVREPK